MANRQHHTFAKQFIQNSIEAVANQTATETDRANVINGAVLELLEELVARNGNGHGWKGKARQNALPVAGGAGLVAVIMEVIRAAG